VKEGGKGVALHKVVVEGEDWSVALDTESVAVDWSFALVLLWVLSVSRY